MISEIINLKDYYLIKKTIIVNMEYYWIMNHLDHNLMKIRVIITVLKGLIGNSNHFITDNI
jgi:hypothetical protein